MPTTDPRIKDSITLIHNEDKTTIGTGFVIQHSPDAVYILTCAHVVNDIGGPSEIRVETYPAEIIAMGDANRLDLAVLRVEGLWNIPPLRISQEEAVRSIREGHPIETNGFQKMNKAQVMRPLYGALCSQITIQSGHGTRVDAWDLSFESDDVLQPGYSGSPVIDSESNQVIAVISHRRQGGRKGIAISITALETIWRAITPAQIYTTLLKLGYRRQANLFLTVVNQQSIAAFLIHGPPEYGQRWLLNRIVREYMPNSLNAREVVIELGRKSRKNNISALWRELKSATGIRGSATPAEVAQRVCRWWRTQDVLIILHDVNYLSEDNLKKIVNDFWLLLLKEAKQIRPQPVNSKLYLFLIDYEGNAASARLPSVKSLDLATWTPRLPICSPKLAEFSYADLTTWIEAEFKTLPSSITNAIDETVENVLDISDGGIPERALEEICTYCGCSWYEVKRKWLRY